MQIKFGARRPNKFGGVTVAAGLGLLLLLGGCMTSYGQPENVLEEVDSSDRSSLSSLFGGLFGAMMGSTESSSEGKSRGERDPNKTEGPSLIELEALKAQALEDQRRGIACVDCIPDGEGNMLPAKLVHSIQLQNAKTRVNHSQAKKRTASFSKEQDDHTSQDKTKHARMSDSADSSASDDTSKLNFDVSSQRRQLSKSKGGGIIFPPISPPIVITCRCEYPSENIFPGGLIEDRFIDGILILPGNSIYCRNVDFICPDEDPPTGSIEWTCPNFNIVNPPIIGKGKGKGNKNRNNIIGLNNGIINTSGKSKNSFVGTPCFGNGNIIRTIVNGGIAGVGGFNTIVTGKSKCGKGKGNKNRNNLCCGNNCGCILPPVPSRPQYVILPPEDPDCADRPTPPAPTQPPPPPTDGALPDCEEPYDEWRDCVFSSGCTGCRPIPSSPDGLLLPGEECDTFEDWFPVNYLCCPDCVDELADFEECKDCNFPPPTPRPTPGGTAPPLPTAPDGPECQEPYEDWVDCVDDEECDDCDTTIPGRTAREAQTPGANCDAFVPWYLENRECCDGTCNPALEEFADCKDCDIPIPEEPTAAPSPEDIPPGEIRGFVFVDLNGNGSRDPGEPGIPGVSVRITDVFGSSQTVTTNRNGRYRVVVPAGPAVTNIIETTLPPGSEQTAGRNPSTLLVRPDRITRDVDGYQISGPSPTPIPPTNAPPTPVPPTPLPSGTVTGVVFEDINGNGVQDEGEPGIDDVDVVITDSTGSVQTVQTRRNGSYTAEVSPGSVVVDIDEDTLPPGALQTAGSNPTTLVVTPGGSASDEDGYQITGKVKGIVYEDANGNGRQDSGEDGLEDVDVEITDSNGDVQTVTTDDTGMYMAVVPVGRTDIEIIEETLPPGAVQTDGDNPTTVEVRPGRTTEDEDGYQLVGEVRGVVFEDTNGNGVRDSGEPGISGVDVVITDDFGEEQTVTTRSNGRYRATVPAGPAVIFIDVNTLPSGLTQTAGENPTDVDVPAGGIARDEDGFQPRSPTPAPASPTRAPTPPPTPVPQTPVPAKPTRKPTASPTKAPTTPPTPGGGECVEAEIMFDKLPDGTVLEPGEYISDQYEPFYGVTFSSTGKGALGDFPRLFDSTNPAVRVGEGMCGDKDLGAPNRECPGGGPGKGEGGEPGPDGDNPYKNCEPLGNILIIQEDNSDNRCGNGIPDDNQDGGVITIDFSPFAEAIYELSLLDVDYPISVAVATLVGDTISFLDPIEVPITGDNSFQTIQIQEKNVVQIRLTLKRSGAIPYIRGKFCPPSYRRALGGSGNELRGAIIGSDDIRTASLDGMKTETAMERAQRLGAMKKQ